MATKRRVHIGGLSRSIINAGELSSKFESFGEVSNTIVVTDTETGYSKGYAFLDLLCTDKEWQRCISILNGSRWKGGVLKVDLAKGKSWEERDYSPTVEKVVKMPRRRLGNLHHKDMELMTDDKLDNRKGWKKARFGRAVAELKIRRPDGQVIKVDPERYQHLLKSFKKKEKEIEEEMKNIEKERLTWFADKIKDDNIEISKVEISKLRQLEAIAKKKELQNQAQKQIKAALSNIDRAVKENPNKIIFEDSEDGELEGDNENKDQDENYEFKEAEFIKQKSISLFDDSEDETEGEKYEADDEAKKANTFLFDDNDEAGLDSENENEVFGIKKVFEGAEGQRRLALQRRYGNDIRFKLDEQFIDSDEESLAENSQNEKTESLKNEDDIQISLQQEKGTSLQVLNDLLGTQHQLQTSNSSTDQRHGIENKKGGVEWKAMVRYDPDASDAEELEINPNNLVPATQIKKNDVKGKIMDSISNQIKAKIKSDPLPEVSSEKHFQVSEKVSSIFNKDEDLKDTGSFSLFGLLGQGDEEEIESEEINEDYTEAAIPSFSKTEHVDSQEATFAPIVTEVPEINNNINSEPFFFYHFNTPLFFKARFEGEKVFQRTQTIAKIREELRRQRKFLKQSCKSRIRNANMKKKKFMKKDR